MEHHEHNIGDHEDPIPSSTWLVGAVGVVLFVVIIFGLTALYYNAQKEENEAKLHQPMPVELARYRERQQRHFVEQPSWVERQAGGNHIRARVIPLDQAMEDVIEEFGR